MTRFHWIDESRRERELSLNELQLFFPSDCLLSSSYCARYARNPCMSLKKLAQPKQFSCSRDVLLPRKPGCSARCFRLRLLEFWLGFGAVEARVLDVCCGLRRRVPGCLRTTADTPHRSQQKQPNSTNWLNKLAVARDVSTSKWECQYGFCAQMAADNFTHHEMQSDSDVTTHMRK